MEDLIIKYLRGEITPQEIVRLFDWADVNPENMETLKTMRQTWDIYGLTKHLDSDSKLAEKAFRKIENKLTRPPLIVISLTTRAVLKIAAIIVITLGLGWLVYLRYNSDKDLPYTTIEIPVQQRLLITLSDSTKAWLNSGTKFSFPLEFKGNKRQVKLDGEAYFEVKSIPAQPFILSSANHEIKVLGTKFNVFAYSNETISAITLLEGKINLKDKNTNYEKFLTKGQSIRHQKGVGFSSVDTGGTHLKDASWINGTYDFDNVTFKEMMRKLSRYYKVEIIIKNVKLENIRFTGKFKQEDTIETILKVIKISQPFNYKIQQNEIIIY